MCCLLPGTALGLICLSSAGRGSGGAVAGTTTEPGSLQQHEAAQKQPTHQRHPEGLRLHKTLTFWLQYIHRLYTDTSTTQSDYCYMRQG
jgi:hypothetical protein